MFVALSIATASVHANGRLPGATGLAIHPSDNNELLLGLTYGLALTVDGGASWSWMCEQQIDGNGGNVDPAIVLTGNGSIVVLSLTSGGVLVSQDHGCTFVRPPGELERNRGVDLTLDPSQPDHVYALLSTIMNAVDGGSPTYRNLLAHSLDSGASWQVLAQLPDDLSAETVEVAPSDPKRIYVSGTASSDPLQGVVERSDDGGRTWKRTTVRLPRGSGSLYLSAIHPSDPDRLWFRVPGRGDIYGVLPAKLWLSTDGASSFSPLGETQAGMLGLALSPAGDRVAFGGPSDGLFVVPADASAAPTKVSDLPVSCLRWRTNGLYLCALEPIAPFSLGFAAQPGGDFVPLWKRANTCRPACAPPSPLEMKCGEPWQMIAPLIDASTAVCGEAGSISGMFDASAVARSRVDGSISTVDASRAATMTPPSAAAGSCTVMSSLTVRVPWWLATLTLMTDVFVRRRRRNRDRGCV